MIKERVEKAVEGLFRHSGERLEQGDKDMYLKVAEMFSKEWVRISEAGAPFEFAESLRACGVLDMKIEPILADNKYPRGSKHFFRLNSRFV